MDVLKRSEYITSTNTIKFQFKECLAVCFQKVLAIYNNNFEKIYSKEYNKNILKIFQIDRSYALLQNNHIIVVAEDQEYSYELPSTFQHLEPINVTSVGCTFLIIYNKGKQLFGRLDQSKLEFIDPIHQIGLVYGLDVVKCNDSYYILHLNNEDECISRDLPSMCISECILINDNLKIMGTKNVATTSKLYVYKGYIIYVGIKVGIDAFVFRNTKKKAIYKKTVNVAENIANGTKEIAQEKDDIDVFNQFKEYLKCLNEYRITCCVQYSNSNILFGCDNKELFTFNGSKNPESLGFFPFDIENILHIESNKFFAHSKYGDYSFFEINLENVSSNEKTNEKYKLQIIDKSSENSSDKSQSSFKKRKRILEEEVGRMQDIKSLLDQSNQIKHIVKYQPAAIHNILTLHKNKYIFAENYEKNRIGIYKYGYKASSELFFNDIGRINDLFLLENIFSIVSKEQTKIYDNKKMMLKQIQGKCIHFHNIVNSSNNSNLLSNIVYATRERLFFDDKSVRLNIILISSYQDKHLVYHIINGNKMLSLFHGKMCLLESKIDLSISFLQLVEKCIFVSSFSDEWIIMDYTFNVISKSKIKTFKIGLLLQTSLLERKMILVTHDSEFYIYDDFQFIYLMRLDAFISNIILKNKNQILILTNKKLLIFNMKTNELTEVIGIKAESIACYRERIIYLYKGKIKSMDIEHLPGLHYPKIYKSHNNTIVFYSIIDCRKLIGKVSILSSKSKQKQTSSITLFTARKKHKKFFKGLLSQNLVKINSNVICICINHIKKNESELFIMNITNKIKIIKKTIFKGLTISMIFENEILLLKQKSCILGIEIQQNKLIEKFKINDLHLNYEITTSFYYKKILIIVSNLGEIGVLIYAYDKYTGALEMTANFLKDAKKCLMIDENLLILLHSGKIINFSMRDKNFKDLLMINESIEDIVIYSASDILNDKALILFTKMKEVIRVRSNILFPQLDKL